MICLLIDEQNTNSVGAMAQGFIAELSWEMDHLWLEVLLFM